MDDRRILDTERTDPPDAVERIAEEFRVGFRELELVHQPAVTLFGSARIGETHPAYALARETGRLFGEHGWTVITGGGGGAMEAANRGAQEGGGQSVGWNIAVPHEQRPNGYLDVEHTFDHFYARKVSFVKPSEGFVILPGGFGTLDEMFEALTLIQTGKVWHFPVVLIGADFWAPLVGWIRETLLAQGMISANDVELLYVTDAPEEAVDLVVECYERRCAEVPAAAHKEDAQ